MRCVLASASPRRLEILHDFGIAPDIRPVRIDESPLDGESPGEMVRRLASSKARQAIEESQARAGDLLVVGADTIVVLDGEMLGKPIDAEDAVRMLSRLSGRSHEVLTGLCVVHTAANGEITDACHTRVRFWPLSPAQIREYVATGEPMDKAGAYGIQAGGGGFVERIEGSYTNVVGLPVELLQEILARFGLALDDLRNPR